MLHWASTSDRLKSRWGTDFLHTEEECLAGDGFWQRDDSTGSITPNYSGMYAESIRQAKQLNSRNRIALALMTLEPMLTMYPDNQEALSLMQEYLQKVK